MVFGSPGGYWSTSSISSATWQRNDWAPLFAAQRDLFNKETKIAEKAAKHGLAQRSRIISLLDKASQMWEAASWFQTKAKEAHAAGNPILAACEMGEARRLAYEYSRLIQECQRLITESQAMALAQREEAQMSRRKLRAEYAARYLTFA